MATPIPLNSTGSALLIPQPSIPKTMRRNSRFSTKLPALKTSLPSAAEAASKRNRQRSSSIVSVTEITDNYDDALDAAIMPNVG